MRPRRAGLGDPAGHAGLHRDQAQTVRDHVVQFPGDPDPVVAFLLAPHRLGVRTLLRDRVPDQPGARHQRPVFRERGQGVAAGQGSRSRGQCGERAAEQRDGLPAGEPPGNQVDDVRDRELRRRVAVEQGKRQRRGDRHHGQDGAGPEPSSGRGKDRQQDDDQDQRPGNRRRSRQLVKTHDGRGGERERGGAVEPNRGNFHGPTITAPLKQRASYPGTTRKPAPWPDAATGCRPRWLLAWTQSSRRRASASGTAAGRPSPNAH